MGNFQEGEEECPVASARDRHCPGMSRRQGAAPDELAWAPAPRSAGRTKLMWERPLVRIAALHPRRLWACWFALDRLVFCSSTVTQDMDHPCVVYTSKLGRECPI